MLSRDCSILVPCFIPTCVGKARIISKSPLLDQEACWSGRQHSHIPLTSALGNPKGNQCILNIWPQCQQQHCSKESSCICSTAMGTMVWLCMCTQCCSHCPQGWSCCFTASLGSIKAVSAELLLFAQACLLFVSIQKNTHSCPLSRPDAFGCSPGSSRTSCRADVICRCAASFPTASGWVGA